MAKRRLHVEIKTYNVGAFDHVVLGRDSRGHDANSGSEGDEDGLELHFGGRVRLKGDCCCLNSVACCL